MDTTGGPGGAWVPVWVCAVLADPDGRVCAMRRHQPDGVLHLLSGALATLGEHPVDAVRRELVEELGLGLAVAKDVGLVLRFEQQQETRRPGRAVPPLRLCRPPAAAARCRCRAGRAGRLRTTRKCCGWLRPIWRASTSTRISAGTRPPPPVRSSGRPPPRAPGRCCWRR
ncbi:NUDIX hydrolase [Kitasatospora cineracea]|uniref:NUDIX hydrolase n=1 Tax=Kitasatospora cineracea TaxID=88074 RepID=UPI0037AE3A02